MVLLIVALGISLKAKSGCFRISLAFAIRYNGEIDASNTPFICLNFVGTVCGCVDTICLEVCFEGQHQSVSYWLYLVVQTPRDTHTHMI